MLTNDDRPTDTAFLPTSCADGGGDIFEIAWDRRGERLAACYSTGKVAVLDFRK